MQARQKYDREFKQSAVELAQTSGKTMAELERELGISQGLLKQSVRAAKRDGGEVFPGNGRLKASDDELRRLQRENAILTRPMASTWRRANTWCTRRSICAGWRGCFWTTSERRRLWSEQIDEECCSWDVK